MTTQTLKVYEASCDPRIIVLASIEERLVRHPSVSDFGIIDENDDGRARFVVHSIDPQETESLLSDIQDVYPEFELTYEEYYIGKETDETPMMHFANEFQDV